MARLAPINILVPLAALGLMSTYFRIASIDAERQMERLAMTDTLTRLPNRRRMWELLRGQVAAANREARCFGVLIGDVDHFKAIHDSLGHDGGDAVLRAVAEHLSQAVRTDDRVSRWGGEEFLVLLPGTDLEGATEIAERLRLAVSDARIPWDESEIHATVTFGIACWTPSRSIDDCIREADAALYAGKAGGRDRVVAESLASAGLLDAGDDAPSPAGTAYRAAGGAFTGALRARARGASRPVHLRRYGLR